MNYKTKKITYPHPISRLIDLNPVGIWENQDRYIFLKEAYTISLTNNCFYLKSKAGETVTYEFNKPLGSCITEILHDLGFKNNSEIKMFGFISYDYAKNLENIRGFYSSEKSPEIFLIIPETYIKQNHNSTEIEIFDLHGNFPELLEAKIEETNKAETEPNINWSSDLTKFCQQTKQAQEYIAAGDIFQIVLSNQLILNKQFNPHTLYKELLIRNPSAFHFLLKFDRDYLVGASPETMLKFDPISRKMLMRLIAGTYPKVESIYTKAPELLLSDEKELAEHMMLVDHCRNDLGRVAEIGSVKVTELLKIEPLNDVYHLVSEVAATLKNKLNCFDAIDSCFPIATLTGTPKIRAMEIISELEKRPRGLFGGAVGLFGLDGSADLAVIIRSAIVSQDKCEINAGAGIVADSIPEREFEECLWKAQALKEILTNDIIDR